MTLDGLTGLGVISFWAILLLRLPDVFRRTAFRSMYLSIVALGLSVTLYYRPVAILLAGVFGSARPCNVGMNLWGMLTSGVVLALVAKELRPALTRAVYLLTTAVIVLVAAMSYTISKASVGCVTSLDLPWWDPYWWLIAPFWIIAGASATVLCIRNFRSASGDKPLTAAMVFYLAGFVSSLLFWAGIFAFLLFRPVWVLLWLPFLLCVHIWSFTFGLLLGLAAPEITAARMLPKMLRRWILWRKLDKLAVGLTNDVVAAASGGMWLDFLRNPKLGVYRAETQIRDSLAVLGDYVDQPVGTPSTWNAHAAAKVVAFATSPEGLLASGETDFDLLARFVRDLPEESAYGGV